MEDEGQLSGTGREGEESGDRYAASNSMAAGSRSSQKEGAAGGTTHHNEAVGALKTSVNKKKNVYSLDPTPMNSPWTFWIEKDQRGDNVVNEISLKKIKTAYTVHNFWEVFYNIPKPSKLQSKCSFHMMRDEWKPVWEEPYNCKGGTFRISVQKKDTDKVWQGMLLAAIGEQLHDYVAEDDEICGVSVSIHDEEDVIEVWNSNSNVAVKARVFEFMRLILPDTKLLSTSYIPHVVCHASEKPRSEVTEFKLSMTCDI